MAVTKEGGSKAATVGAKGGVSKKVFLTTSFWCCHEGPNWLLPRAKLTNYKQQTEAHKPKPADPSPADGEEDEEVDEEEDEDDEENDPNKNQKRTLPPRKARSSRSWLPGILISKSSASTGH